MHFLKLQSTAYYFQPHRAPLLQATSYKLQARKGFILIELLVAVGVFAVVAVFATSALLTLTSVQRKAASVQNVQDNVRFAMDAIAKEIRAGENFVCSATPCSDLVLDIRRIDADGKELLIRVNYKLESGRIMRREESDPSAVFLPVTAEEVKVTRLDFYIFRDPVARQPSATIVLRANVSGGKNQEGAELNFQTTVTQRIFAL